MQFTEMARAGYSKLFSSMVINEQHKAVSTRIGNDIVRSRYRYSAVETTTGVPWWWIGVVHSMEAGLNFATHLHNGDPLTARTVHRPAGRPASGIPPFRWEDSAADALRLKELHRERDWSIPKALYNFERYNGFGYVARGVNSPYLWSFSNLYRHGKYVRDGVWDANAVSQQCGAAVLLKTLINLGVVTERPSAMSELHPFYNVIGALAPTAVRLLAGPFAEMALKALGSAFETQPNAADIAARIAATPGELLVTALKQAEEALAGALPDQAAPVQEDGDVSQLPVAAPVSNPVAPPADPASALADALQKTLLLAGDLIANRQGKKTEPVVSANGVLVDPVASVVKAVVAGVLFVLTAKFLSAERAWELSNALGGLASGIGGVAMTWLLHRSVSNANTNTIAALSPKH